MNAISRRALLKQLTVGGLLAALPTVRTWATVPELFNPLATRLMHALSNRDSAEAVGRCYLALGAEPADAALLAARVAGSTAGYLRLCGARTDDLRALLARQQREDFAAGRTVIVKGWVLSITEARLCAIATVIRAAG